MEGNHEVNGMAKLGTAVYGAEDLDFSLPTITALIDFIEKAVQENHRNSCKIEMTES